MGKNGACDAGLLEDDAGPRAVVPEGECWGIAFVRLGGLLADMMTELGFTQSE